MLENRTWFEGVELLPPGTIFSWDIATATSKTRRYWWWDEIKPLSESAHTKGIIETPANCS
jgi:asparagine synthase (glutamine-hydrolysing)